MRMQIALLLLMMVSLSKSVSKTVNSTQLIVFKSVTQVFTNDGQLYKLNPISKQVQWSSSLPHELLTIDVSPEIDAESEISQLIIPTLDGDFLYLQKMLKRPKSKQILIERKDIETMLDVCIQRSSANSNIGPKIEENQDISDQKHQNYLVYETTEYFVINMESGGIKSLEDYFNSDKQYEQGQFWSHNKYSIIVLNKKLLKQMNNKMQKKWSVISSKIHLLAFKQFMKLAKGKSNFMNKAAATEHPQYKFLRSSSKEIQIRDQNHELIFEIETNSPIVSIFSRSVNLKSQDKFSQVRINNAQPNILALEAKIEEISPQHSLTKIEQVQRFEDFPSSQTFRKEKDEFADDSQFQQDLSDIQVCLSTHKFLKEIHENAQDRNHFEFVSGFKDQYMPTLPYSFDSRNLPPQIIVTKEQPYTLIFLFMTIIVLSLCFYCAKISKLWNQISEMESINDQKISKISQRLGEFENAGKQLKKMYEVNWDKLIINHGKYLVFEGRFVNMEASVYVLPLAGSDIVDVEHNLNNLFSCSHPKLAKLYYYTKNNESLLVFTERLGKFQRMTEISCEKYSIFSKNPQKYRNCIRNFLQCIEFVYESKVTLNALIQQSMCICINESSDSVDIKIDIVPSIFARGDGDPHKELQLLGTTRVRLNLVEIIHRLGHGGKEFDVCSFQQQKNTEEEENFFLKDFYDYILTSPFSVPTKCLDANSSQTDVQQLHEQIAQFRKITNHPYIWNSQQVLHYMSEFSNYAETCLSDSKILKMQEHCKTFNVIPVPWVKHLHPALVKEINSYRKYDYQSVRDLIRFVRNKLNHFHEIPKQTKTIVGKTPEQFVQYVLQRFPKLLSFMYAYASKKKWKLNVQ